MIGRLALEKWPERYKGGVWFMSPSQAKDWLESWTKRGYVHIIMQEGGDFIAGLCMCDYPTCIAIRNRLDYGLVYSTVKAEYLAAIEAFNGWAFRREWQFTLAVGERLGLKGTGGSDAHRLL